MLHFVCKGNVPWGEDPLGPVGVSELEVIGLEDGDSGYREEAHG